MPSERRGCPGGTRPPLPARRSAGAAIVAVLCVLALGCGRKGPPLAPIVRIPAAIERIEARRVGDDVYVTFTIPAANVDGTTPGDVARVEVFAVTAGEPPAGGIPEAATRIATIPVLPPPAEDEREDDARDTGEAPAGTTQGANVTVHERLTPDVLGDPPAAVSPDAGRSERSRYYMAVALSGRGRSRAAAAQAAVPLAAAPPPPDGLRAMHSAEDVVLSWNAVPGAASYNVYLRVDAPEAAVAPSEARWAARAPAPLNGAPIAQTSYREPVVFGRERCFQVRSVAAGEVTVEGPPSAAVCERPADTFAPAAPTELSALTTNDGILLRWAPNPEPDVAGYLVLRGRAGDATLLQITGTPLEDTRYVDRDVMPGVRYVYAVVAVDAATPAPNRSPESERDEATAP